MTARHLFAGAVSAGVLLVAGCASHPLCHRTPPPAVVSSSPVCSVPTAPACPDPQVPLPGSGAPYAPPPPANIGIGR